MARRDTQQDSKWINLLTPDGEPARATERNYENTLKALGYTKTSDKKLAEAAEKQEKRASEAGRTAS